MDRKLHKIDATDQSIGRMSTRIANILRGKLKADYAPYLDMGDIVEVVNIAKAKFTGKKAEQKVYHSYSGHPGGLKTKKMSEILVNDPADILRRSVREMLPPNRLRDGMLKRLIIR